MKQLYGFQAGRVYAHSMVQAAGLAYIASLTCRTLAGLAVCRMLVLYELHKQADTVILTHSGLHCEHHVVLSRHHHVGAVTLAMRVSIGGLACNTSPACLRSLSMNHTLSRTHS